MNENVIGIILIFLIFLLKTLICGIYSVTGGIFGLYPQFMFWIKNKKKKKVFPDTPVLHYKYSIHGHIFLMNMLQFSQMIKE